MKIAVVGAPTTGKTRLAQALAQHLPELQVSDAPAPEALKPGAYAHVLLMGLDLPDSTTAQQAADADLRAQLAADGVAYGVVYGLGPQRLRSALRLITPQDGPPPRWTGPCERCADPDCELRTLLPRI
jgi:dephospho-CoA kinase